jgi:hypothetical protein
MAGKWLVKISGQTCQYNRGIQNTARENNPARRDIQVLFSTNKSQGSSVSMQTELRVERPEFDPR